MSVILVASGHQLNQVHRSEPGCDVSVWCGCLGPAKMPPELAAKIRAGLKTALQDPVVQKTLEQIGATHWLTAHQLNSMHMHAEATKWEPLLKATNIRTQ